MNILIYSNYCQHSGVFANTLSEIPSLRENFELLNIDINPKTNSRPPFFYEIQRQLNHKITEVPTIIIGGGEYILSGEEAFKWLEFQLQQLQQAGGEQEQQQLQHQPDLQGFNPNEMGAFSDSYAPLGTTDMNSGSDQSFRFINRTEQSIETPPETGAVTSEEYTRKQREREAFGNTTEAPMRETFHTPRQYTDRMVPMQNQVPEQRSLSKGKKNTKQKEVDARLQELLMQRDQMNDSMTPKKRQQLNRR